MTTSIDKENSILLIYRPNAPMDLANFSSSITAFSDIYFELTSKKRQTKSSPSSTLKIAEIRQGSIIFELYNWCTQVDLFHSIENAVILYKFGQDLHQLLKYFSGPKEEKPENLTAAKARKIIGFVEPVLEDSESEIKIINNGQINININYHNGKEIKENAQRYIENQKTTTQKTCNSQYFRWYQTRRSLGNKTGDKGIIEDVSLKIVNTFIPNNDIKNKMVEGDIFNKTYVVDVVVESDDEEPRLFTITNLIEVIDER